VKKSIALISRVKTFECVSATYIHVGLISTICVILYRAIGLETFPFQEWLIYLDFSQLGVCTDDNSTDYTDQLMRYEYTILGSALLYLIFLNKAVNGISRFHFLSFIFKCSNI